MNRMPFQVLATALTALSMSSCHHPLPPPISPDAPRIDVAASAINACQTVNWTIKVLKDGTDITGNYTYKNVSGHAVPAVAVPSFDLTSAGAVSVLIDPSDVTGIDTYTYTLTCQANKSSTAINVPVRGPLQRVKVGYTGGQITAQF